MFVTWEGKLLGTVEVLNCRSPISWSRLGESIVDSLFFEILACAKGETRDSAWASVHAAVHDRYRPSPVALPGQERKTLPEEVSVSVIVATCDRPDNLRQCLCSILAQETLREIEIVVVDNHPSSGLAAPVVADFPTVRLVEERRRGVAYARNAAFAASTGQIIVTTDDEW